MNPVYATTPADPSIPGCELIGDVPSFGCLAASVVNVINLLVTFIGAVALIFMLLGAIRIIIARGDPKALEKGKKTFTYAIFGVIAFIAVFVLSNIFATSLGIPNPLSDFTLWIK